ncbi:MAG: porin [Gammaproteobacteria bacterium]|nr:porin [Gammaproteobacteria bacterium]
MKTKILLAAVAGALVMPVPMASQADVMGGTDFTIYGRVVAGAVRTDTGRSNESAVWDLGATGIDGSQDRGSRVGFKADRDLGGLTVGFKLERGFDQTIYQTCAGVSTDSNGNVDHTTAGSHVASGKCPSGSRGTTRTHRNGFNARHQYVYLSGDFGTVTIGNQSNPYLMGANWAQEWYFGGNTVGSFREEGIGYAWSNDAFNLNVLLTGNNGDSSSTDRTTAAGRVADETIDRTIIGASYDFGVVKVGFGYNKDNTENDYDWTSIGVSGSVDRFGYYVGYQTKSDSRQSGATADTGNTPRPGGMQSDVGNQDQSGWGTFLSYDISDADKVYLEYETQEDDWGTKPETTYTVVGYSRSLGGSARFIAEYGKTDYDGSAADPTNLALTVMVGF